MIALVPIQQFLGIAYLIGYTSIYYLSFTVVTVQNPPMIDIAYDGYAMPMILAPILGTVVAIAIRRTTDSQVKLPIPSFHVSLVGHAIVYAIVLNLLLGPKGAALWVEGKGLLKVVVYWLVVFPISAFVGGWIGVGIANAMSGSYLKNTYKIFQFGLAAIAGFAAFILILIFAFLLTALVIGVNPVLFFAVGTIMTIIMIRLISPKGLWRIGAYSGFGLIFAVFFMFNFV
ncbi:MAG: hypothetical protein GY777_29635 [Candidatus Brocadiaceae bacterium]|nr:hypothetical protein [Candidatus Brocadiaceae bacterium]